MVKKAGPLPEKFPRKQKEGSGMDYSNCPFPKPTPKKRKRRK